MDADATTALCSSTVFTAEVTEDAEEPRAFISFQTEEAMESGAWLPTCLNACKNIYLPGVDLLLATKGQMIKTLPTTAGMKIKAYCLI